MNLVKKLLNLSGSLVVLLFTNPGALRHVLGIALHAAGQVRNPETDVRSLPAISVDDLVSEVGRDEELRLHSFSGIPASVSPLEAYALAVLVKLAGARNAFEFGTYKGVSSTQLVLNLDEPARLFTLDLPEDDPRCVLAIDKSEEVELTRERKKGSLVPERLREKIEFLKSDSAVFDETPYVGQIDFVFVDGAHSWEYVKNDSEKGWRMLKKGGVMAWHDCAPNHRDVVRYLKGSGFKPRLISGTALAFAVKS